MDLSEAPQDTELRNIIDKLAQFVARNGPDFEQMTKNKQKGNPKFQFLFGGEYYNYYQCKVAAEQAIYKHQQQTNGSDQNSNWSASPVQMQANQPEIDRIVKQQDVLREQIKQSEQNLTAQHTVLVQQQQAQVEQIVAKCETADLQKMADNCGIILTEVYSILQPIIDSCTKDSISNGKSWFLQHAADKTKADCIVESLLYKVLQSSSFPSKLHVIYLVNDLLHHSARKNANDLKQALERVVVPMFCNASIAATDEQRLKLDKLLKLWESKMNYLDPKTLEKMHKPLQSYQQYQADQMAKYSSEIAPLTQQTKLTFDSYQAQHQAFVCHAMQQIMDLQQQKQNLEQGSQPQPPAPQQTAPQPQTTTNNALPLETIQATLQQTIQSLSQSAATTTQTATSQQQQSFNVQNDTYMNVCVPPPGLNSQPPLPTTPAPSTPVQTVSTSGQPQVPPIPPLFPAAPVDVTQAPPTIPQPPPLPNANGGLDAIPFTQPPPGYFPPPGMFPDFSKPPPGFPAKPEPILEELMPTAPYYDLPAGLMVPLVKVRVRWVWDCG
ncbi:unnamed protein product [Acanthoscelides obtectus]|uniref:Calcium homeostasis endoplasmic reticulum protein n=1 Tax=Acanthoscelides obtectus TaxID=200917 RepID=A0A9P0KEY7_ACAOB|nr:unnamed protein product [Acanthoscelides obtectus]CAK1620625.1 Calcium homeostasis endoplasmic reticulum protein [Acanthoscelides obtectus]